MSCELGKSVVISGLDHSDIAASKIAGLSVLEGVLASIINQLRSRERSIHCVNTRSILPIERGWR